MGELSIGYLCFITIITIVISLLIIYREPLQHRLIYYFAIFGIYVYSGIGIAYDVVDKRYIFTYGLFLAVLLLTMKVVFHLTFSTQTKIAYKKWIFNPIEETIDVASDSKVVKWLAILYLCTLGIYLFIPKFRLMDFFIPHFANIVLNNVYATNAAYNSNIILKLSSTLNIMSLPFFCVYIQHLIENDHKRRAIILAVLSIYLEFLQKNYLGRYKMVIYFVFIFFLIAFIKKDGFKFNVGKIAILFGILLLSVPFLYSFMAIRSGGVSSNLAFSKTLGLLLESEVYFPKYFETCQGIFFKNGSIGLKFIMYIICLPIPSVIFPSKPTVNASFYLTFAETGRWFGDANYTSCLPSVVGEGLIIWGNSLIWLHAIVLGVVIAIVFKFLTRYKSLNVLYVYYAVNLLALGRGGAESYLSGLVNGTIILILWVIILKRYRIREYNMEKDVCMDD